MPLDFDEAQLLRHCSERFVPEMLRAARAQVSARAAAVRRARAGGGGGGGGRRGGGEAEAAGGGRAAAETAESQWR